MRRRPSSCHVASRPKLSVGFWIFEDQEVTEVTSLEMFRSEDPRSAGCLEGAPLHEERGTAGEHCSHHSSPSLAALRSRTGPRTWAQPQPKKAESGPQRDSLQLPPSQITGPPAHKERALRGLSEGVSEHSDIRTGTMRRRQPPGPSGPGPRRTMARTTTCGPRPAAQGWLSGRYRRAMGHAGRGLQAKSE